MKRINHLWLLLVALTLALPSHAQQHAEFPVYANGMIYGDTADVVAADRRAGEPALSCVSARSAVACVAASAVYTPHARG